MPIDSEENVARLLCSEWVDNGDISVDAFALAPNETYLSVNRPAVDTFRSDVEKIVSSHQGFVTGLWPLSLNFYSPILHFILWI